MFNVISSMPDIFNSAIYPSAKQIVMDVLNRLGFSDFFQNNINYKSNGSTISSSTNDVGTIKIQQNRLDVDIIYSFAVNDQKYEVTKAIDNSQQMLNHLNNANIKVIFHEAVDGFTIREYERPLTITSVCTMVFNDLVSAIDAIQRLNNAFSGGVIQSNILYSCFIPPAIYVRLYEMYKFAELDPANFMAYLTRFSGSRIVKTCNRHDNTDVALSIVHNKAEIITNVELQTGSPAPIGDPSSPNMYNVVFTLTTQLSMANLIGLEYPIVVRNKLVTKEFITIPESEQYAPPSVTHPYFSIAAYNNLIARQEPLIPMSISIPWYDTWVPSSRSLLEKYKPFLIAVITLDDITNEDGVTIIDLEGDLGGVTLIPEVITSLKIQGARSLFLLENINVSVYRNEVMVEPTTLTLENGTKLTIYNRNTSGVYHLVLSAMDIVMMPNRALWVGNVDITVK